jgi:iron complex outermembrane receptor protein
LEASRDYRAAEQPAEVVELEAVEVTADAERGRSARSGTVLLGEELRLQVADTLGKTLERQLGLRNASFGPGVGVPVIRGLTGNRIRTLQDGIGSHDAASVSPDHAVTIEPLLADEIEILRGPATVRFGSGAIGGAVNAVDHRIPEGPSAGIVGGASELHYGGNGDEFAVVGKAKTGLAPFALHLDGFYRIRGDLEVPGSAIDQAAVRRQFGLSRVPSVKGHVPNTDSEAGGGTVGWSVSGDRGLLGMAVNHLANDYGIPTGGHGLGHSHGGRRHGERVRIDLKQTRYDFKAEWFEPMAYLEAAKLRIGLVDYEHSEVDLGLRNTTFRNEVLEGRFELPFHPLDFLSGSLGLHWSDRRFSALGRETFAPPTGIDMLAGYFTERLELGAAALELGLRAERQTTVPERRGHTVGGLYEVPLPGSLDYSPYSVSASLDWPIAEGLTGTLGYSWAQRAPDVQELLSVGPHMATRTFDVGNVALGVEAARNLELGLAWSSRRLETKVNGFYNRVEDYIYLRNLNFFFDAEAERLQLRCAQLDRCLPVYGYSQADAEFLGYEAEAGFRWPETGWGTVKLTLFSDFVRGRFDQRAMGDVPRMPALRYGLRLETGTACWSSSLRLARNEPQNHPGEGETPTPGYLMLSATLDYRWPLGNEHGLLFFLRGDNLLDQEVRNSVSFLRNFSPEAGRSVEIGVRTTF